MNTHRVSHAPFSGGVVAIALVAACGGGSTGVTSFAESSAGSSGADSMADAGTSAADSNADTTSPSGTGTTSDDAGSSETTMAISASQGGTTTESDTGETTDPATSDPTTTTDPTDPTTSDPATSDPVTTEPGTTDDDGGTTTEGVIPCGEIGKDGPVEFSHIWIANSNQGTVSKIDTQTMVELARYSTRPDGAGNPSRTSVNLRGDVAIANRSGGVTMIRARAEDCPDAMNTSNGAGEVLPWQDGCIEWHTPMDYSSQRPVAWTQGTLNEETCEYENPMLWTAGVYGNIANSIEVVLLDGETGIVLDTVAIPEVPNGAYNFGLYGAAVDGEGNFWGSQLDVGSLVRVRLDDLSHDSWPMPTVGYGMTVDHLGRPWTCNAEVARFDPMTELWTIGAGEPGPGGAGCMEDANGVMWVAGYSITAIDSESMDLIATYPMPVINNNPDTGYGRGISIDFDGYVWSPSHWSNGAYRLDPSNGDFEFVGGLDFPYTYSDMTGFALANTIEPQ